MQIVIRSLQLLTCLRFWTNEQIHVVCQTEQLYTYSKLYRFLTYIYIHKQSLAGVELIHAMEDSLSQELASI